MARNTASTRWCFTINNPTQEDKDSVASFIENDNVRYVVVGREVGTSGTPHLQGFLILHSQQRLPWLRSNLCARGHYEKTRGTSQQAADYCKKDGDFDEYGDFPSRAGKRTDVDELLEWAEEFEQQHGRAPQSPDIAKHQPRCYLRFPRAVQMLAHRATPRRLEFEEPREWQVDLKEILDVEPDDRKIIFLVDETGNKGKSWFCRWYLSEYPQKTQVLGIGKKDDLAHHIDVTKTHFLFNLARGQMEYLNYPLLENLKDRMIFSGKYNSTMKIIPHNVHVVVFSNEEPDMTKLSEDRYSVQHI